MSLLETAM